jgi:acetylornithine deacetylase/succinyl-diaminopimelate desuccinylase-like protein
MKSILLVIMMVVCGCLGLRSTITSAMVDEAVGWFQDALRIDSSSIPMPGNELAFVQYLQGKLQAEGITATIYNIPLPGTPINMPMLIAKLPGVQQKYLMMSSHSDTVELSTMDPSDALSGAIIDGYVVGRGAMDMKQQVIANMASMIWTKRLNVPLQKGLMMAVFPGEELGMLGAMLAASDPVLSQLFANVEMAIDEVGGVTTDILGKTFMPITFGDKGACWIDMQVNASIAHGTSYLPTSSLAIYKMAEAVTYIYADNAINNPIYTDVNTIMLSELEHAFNAPYKNLIRRMEIPWKFHTAAEQLASSDTVGAKFLMPQLTRIYHVVEIDSFHALTSTPDKANAIVSALVFPGESCQDAIDEISSKIADESIQFSRHIPDGMSPDFADFILGGSYENPYDPHLTAMFNAIKSVIPIDMPNVTPIHAIDQALSDCTALRTILGIPCIGFEPTRLEPSTYFTDFIHSTYDECPLAGYREGIVLFYHAIQAYVC